MTNEVIDNIAIGIDHTYKGGIVLNLNGKRFAWGGG